jgi:hypothetical protein
MSYFKSFHIDLATLWHLSDFECGLLYHWMLHIFSLCSTQV